MAAASPSGQWGGTPLHTCHACLPPEETVTVDLDVLPACLPATPHGHGQAGHGQVVEAGGRQAFGCWGGAGEVEVGTWQGGGQGHASLPVSSLIIPSALLLPACLQPLPASSCLPPLYIYTIYLSPAHIYHNKNSSILISSSSILERTLGYMPAWQWSPPCFPKLPAPFAQNKAGWRWEERGRKSSMPMPSASLSYTMCVSILLCLLLTFFLPFMPSPSLLSTTPYFAAFFLPCIKQLAGL